MTWQVVVTGNVDPIPGVVISMSANAAMVRGMPTLGHSGGSD
jgi:hypothetical protein